MKKGFTLVEVMVVIVILGILAAVAIPKLFGNIAKAKASEIPAAASIYIDAQNAFLGANSALGNWNQIGYEAPGNGATENFCYNQGTITDTMSVSRLEGGQFGWGATNKVGMNNCHLNSWWSIQIVANGANNVNYLQNVSAESCVPLVHNWQVGSTMAGGCTSPSINEVQSTTPAETPSTQDKSDNSGSNGENSTQVGESSSETPVTPPTQEEIDKQKKTLLQLLKDADQASVTAGTKAAEAIAAVTAANTAESIAMAAEKTAQDMQEIAEKARKTADEAKIFQRAAEEAAKLAEREADRSSAFAKEKRDEANRLAEIAQQKQAEAQAAKEAAQAARELANNAAKAASAQAKEDIKDNIQNNGIIGGILETIDNGINSEHEVP